MNAPPRPASESRSGRMVETLALAHAGGLVMIGSWAFGGNVGWARLLLSILGSAGLLLTAGEWLRRRRTPGESLASFHWLWPLLAFDLLVAVSALHPGFRRVAVEGAEVFLPLPEPGFGPTAARPGVTLQALWLFNALFLPAFNLVVAVRSRTRLRHLLLVAAGNAVGLAVFGSLQKLTHSSGLFFGAVPSPNARFFASFIYANHWGAFAVLSLCLGFGMLFLRPDEPGRYRDFFHSPRFAALIAALVLAASVPLSASRSGTLLAACVLAVALGHGIVGLRARRSETGWGSLPAVTGILLVALLAVAGSAYLAKTEILHRAGDTRQQLVQMRQSGSIGARAELYRDTWSMAKDRLAFGWGLASYPTVFVLYNRQNAPDRLPVYFEDAHSDWLQSVAEVGLVGSACRALLVLLPLAALWRSRPLSAPIVYPLIGCGLLLAYAWVEFPFGNVAVTAAFWLSFFAAVRLAQLEARERAR